MQKKLAIFAIITILIGMLGLTIHKALQIKAITPASTLKKELVQIPDFQFNNLRGIPVSNLDLETGKSTLIIHFSPHCDICDKEAKILFRYYEEFQNSQILWVSKDKKKELEKFAQKHQLDAFPNIQFLKYNMNEFEKVFGTNKLPAILIFDTKFQLLKKIEEGVTARTLVKYTRAANDQ